MHRLACLTRRFTEGGRAKPGMHDLTHSDGQSEALLIRLSRVDTIGCLAFHSHLPARNRVSRLPQ